MRHDKNDDIQRELGLGLLFIFQVNDTSFTVFTDNYSEVAIPRLLWSTSQNLVIFEGQNKSIKCIFAGL